MQASEAEEKRGTRIRRGLTAGAFVATGAFAAFMGWWTVWLARRDGSGRGSTAGASPEPRPLGRGAASRAGGTAPAPLLRR